MNAFELAQPRNLSEAVQALSEPAGKSIALAGGQDVLALMKDYVLQPERVVNLKSLPGLKQIQVEGGNLVLGALVTLADVAESDAVKQGWPALAAAALEAATPQIRNQGTVGGNLCQKPRCWYYRAEELHCLRKGGDACLASIGDHRYHSIMGESACIAPHMSSLATPATAFGASVRVTGPNGERTVALPELYASLNQDPTKDTALAPNEVLTHLTVPSAAGWSVAHEEVRFKQAFDWPMAMATAMLKLEGGVVRDVRLVLGAVAPTPHVDAAAKGILNGQKLTPELAEKAAAAVLAKAEPLEQVAYKVPLTRNLVRRVLLTAGGLGE